jgi:hypothetical protein
MVMLRFHPRLLFLGLLILLLSSGCEKEGFSRVKYEVQCNGDCEVIYKSSSLSNRVVSGSWSVSFQMMDDDLYFLSATKTSTFGSASVKVSIDGEAVAFDETIVPFGTAVVEGVIEQP